MSETILFNAAYHYCFELEPDASFDTLWYTGRYRINISAMQILYNKLDLFPDYGDSYMLVHYFLTGSYWPDLSDVFEIEPTTPIKHVNLAPTQFDLSIRLIYKSNLWFGRSYRSSDAVAIFASYRVSDYLSLGYSHDIVTYEIQTYTNGSHEILIQLRFGKV